MTATTLKARITNSTMPNTDLPRRFVSMLADVLRRRRNRAVIANLTAEQRADAGSPAQRTVNDPVSPSEARTMTTLMSLR